MDLRYCPKCVFRIVIVICTFVIINKLATTPVNAAWYNSNWLYRKSITIDNTKVSGSSNLTNFPVLISVSSDTDLSSEAQADGDDILFTSSNGTTKLDHEIEYYGSGTLVAWVEVPTLDYNDDTVIYMYYGYGSATNQENIAGTWNSDYAAVYHLNESGNGTSGEFLDSTTNSNDGQGGAGSSTNTPTQTSSGRFYNAQDFDGANDFIVVPDAASLQIGGTGTIQSWIYPHSFPTAGNYETLLAKGDWESGIHQFSIFFNGDQDVTMGISGVGGTENLTFSNSNTPVNNWRRVSLTWDGTNIRAYVNGSSSWSRGQSQTPNTSSANLYIAAFNGTSAYAIDGLMDDVRIVDEALSGDWLLTEYNSQNAPGTFYTLGSEEIESAPLTLSSYRFYENANSTNVGSPLAAQDTATSISSGGDQFRLRASVHAGSNVSISTLSLKLQYAERVGTCDTSFTGETYVDMTTTTPIAFYNNTTPTDGSALTDNANDPTHGAHTNVNQTYEEANNFTNSQAAINSGEDGLWDFSLVDYSGGADYSYCIRIVNSDDSELDTYAVIPEVYIPPSLTFTIASVGAGTVNNGITTTTASTETSLPFGDISFGTPRYMAHELTISTNANSGYVVNMKINPGATIQGVDPVNVIDPFSGGSATWTSPASWQSPDGIVANVNSGWLGANTTDTRVTGWSSASELFGPVSTNSHPVMSSTTADSGTTVYVTYALEVNILQPTDVYSGILEYIIIPTY